MKFIRFAEWKMQQINEGIVAIITNHSFLDNPTFRLMRKSLMTTFNQLYIIDLHGNSKKKEVANDGSKDENVFDIQQGVCISIFIKKENLTRKIYHTDFYGTRKTKYDICFNSSLNELNWTELQPQTPHYLFVPQNITHKGLYENGWSLKDIFQKNSLGIFTHRDHFLVGFNEKQVRQRIEKFKQAEDIRRVNEWFSVKDTRDFKVKTALETIQKEEINVQTYAYRPYDNRVVCYNQCLYDRGTSRLDLMKDFISPNKNLALVSVRNCQGVRNWEHVFITNKITDSHLIPIGTYVFPLYYYNGNGNATNYLFNEDGKKDNFTLEFREFIKQNYAQQSPESIFNYIYAILNSPIYREKYIGFLKMDFPKIPFCDNVDLFNQLSNLGKELIQAHLLEKGAWQKLSVGEPMEEFTNEITEIRYENNRLYYNKKQYFDEVSEQVWTFQVGGYKVLERYLKERKGLNIVEEIVSIQNIIKSISFTLKKMNELIQLTQDWI